MIKLIVSDVDGTIVPVGSPDLPARVPGLLRALNEKGILTVLASGRPYPNLLALFPGWEKSNPLIASNGSCILCNDRIVCAVPVCHGTELRKILDIIKDLKCEWAADRPADSVIETASDEMLRVLKGFGTTVSKVEDITACSEPVLKLSVFCPEGAEYILARPEFDEIKSRYHAVSTCDIFIDITAKSADKGTALKTIQERWKIRPEETIVLGDAMNDLGMMKAAARSYAVRTAPEPVLAAATGTMAPPEEYGIVDVLSSLCQTL